MKKRLHTSAKDWEKLIDFAHIIAKNIRAKLPSDWYITIEEIESEIFDTYGHFIENYKPGA